VAGELERWKAKEVKETREEGQPEKDNLGAARERATQEKLTERLEELNKDAESLGKNIDEAEANLAAAASSEDWERLLTLARQLGMLVGDLFVVQTQIRAYLIDLVPVAYQGTAAVDLAIRERLDLINEQGRVVDAWRQVNVAANGLGTDLNLVLGATIGTEPGSTNPLKFSSSGSSYRAGFQLDGPLNRRAERNNYRFALINYERARRSYMALKDKVTRSVRLDLRRLQADRLKFEIARQSLIAAARQVEQAREQLTAPGRAGDSSNTQDVLDALSSLLKAKNNLIGSWVAYETDRLKLLLDLEALELDDKRELGSDAGTSRQSTEENDGMDQKNSSLDQKASR
jgi:hypothetical protein